MAVADVRKAGSSCFLRFLLIALGGLTVAAFIFLAIIYLNWDKILQSDAYQAMTRLGSEFLEESLAINELRIALLETYPSDEIGVSFMRNVRGQDGAYDSLEIELINPKFVEVESGPRLKQKALEVASFAVDHYPEIERYELVMITFTLHKGGYVTYTEWYDYGFTVQELVD